MEIPIKERLVKIRKTLNLNQTEFARPLGLTASSVSRLESGDTIITEQCVRLICLSYNVNEVWLRTGDGEMFNPENISGLKELLECFSQLSPETRKMIQEYAGLLLKNEKALKAEPFASDTAECAGE